MAGQDETQGDSGYLNENHMFRWDHCDLLLDAIDVQLDQLQVQPPKHSVVSTENPINTEIAAGCSISHKETRTRLNRSPDDKEEAESQREQAIWRLQRLLGDACMEATIAGETCPPSDSICTEDFIRRFREEMVDLSRSDSLEQLHEEKANLSDQNQPVAELGVNMSQVNEGTGAAEESKTPESNFSHVTEAVTDHETSVQDYSCSSEARCSAGGPVWGLDSVSTDIGQNIICNERVRRHIHTWTGSLTTDLSDSDTTTRDDSEPQSVSVRSSSSGRVAQCNRTKTCSENRRETFTPVRTSENSQSGWNEREPLKSLQKKCEKEERKLKLKWTQLKDAELCLSELQQKKRHVVQQLEQLCADREQMEKETRALESVLRDNRAEKESVRYQLQKQRESCLLQVQKADQDLASLCEQTLNDGSCMNRSKAIMSMLEREELERQLDSAKTELFAEQRRAREQIESLLEKLEETHEELHRATEAERSLRDRCACLEKRMHKNEQNEKEKENLQRELQHLKTQNHVDLKETQTHLMLLQEDVRLAVMESDRLRMMLEEKTCSCEKFRAEMEQQLRLWAQQLAAECQHLHITVEHDGDPPHSFTAAEALTRLRRIREQLEHVVSRLHQELDSQKQINEQLKKEKEQELSNQRQQLRAEKDQALTSIKTRLIQEHIEELSSLKCAHVSEVGGVAASLRRQLQDKDLELRQLQRSMAQWKQQTAARLALQFEDQLTAELERKASKTREVSPKGEVMHRTKKSVCSDWFHAADSAAAHTSSDVASLKLLRHLQSKVKQLQGRKPGLHVEPKSTIQRL